MMNIQPLDKNFHDRKNFDCGEPSLNKYLQTIARQHDKLDLSRTFVMTTDKNDPNIIGYYTLTTCHIDISSVPEPLRKKYSQQHGIQGALIGRLAVNKDNQNQGLGTNLLMDAMYRIVQSSFGLPCPLIVIDPKNSRVKEFYREFGFEEISPDDNRMYMRLSEIKAHFEQLEK